MASPSTRYTHWRKSARPYPDPHENDPKKMVMDLRAIERLPRQVTLAELREINCCAKSSSSRTRASPYAR